MNIIKRVSILSALAIAAACSGDNDPAPAPTPETEEFEILLQQQQLSLTTGESAAVAFVVTGRGAHDLTLSTQTDRGWQSEISSLVETASAGYSGEITVTAPDQAGQNKVWLTARTSSGEIRSVSMEAEAVAPRPDDPYSTPKEQCTVMVDPFGGSQAAISVHISMTSQVARYYYNLISEEDIRIREQYIGEDWREIFRDGIVENLTQTQIDYWTYKDKTYRFTGYGTYGDIAFTPDTRYYVYIVAQLADGSYSDLELTAASTLPMYSEDFTPAGASEVAVEASISFGTISVSLSPSAAVESYYYDLVDQAAVNGYRQLYGNRWDVGFLDKWSYAMTYDYPDRLSRGADMWTWGNLTPDRQYYLFVVYFDMQHVMHLELTAYRTPVKDAVTGSPGVKVERLAIDASTVTFHFTPNDDCGKYTVDIWSEPDLALWREKYADTFYQELIEYAMNYGRISVGEQTVTLDINDFYPMQTGYTRTWNDNDYTLVIMPFDCNSVYDENGISYTPIRLGGSLLSCGAAERTECVAGRRGVRSLP